MPRPVTTRADDTFDAETRGVHFAAFAAAFEYAEPSPIGDIALAELPRIQLRQIRELVDHAFLCEEVWRVERRA